MAPKARPAGKALVEAEKQGAAQKPDGPVPAVVNRRKPGTASTPIPTAAAAAAAPAAAAAAAVNRRYTHGAATPNARPQAKVSPMAAPGWAREVPASTRNAAASSRSNSGSPSTGRRKKTPPPLFVALKVNPLELNLAYIDAKECVVEEAWRRAEQSKDKKLKRRLKKKKQAGGGPGMQPAADAEPDEADPEQEPTKRDLMGILSKANAPAQSTSEWLEEQMAMTNSMQAMYGSNS